MSEGNPDKVVKMPQLDIIRPDPDMILEHGHQFPGTAALVETLKPYYEHAVHALEQLSGKPAEKKHTAMALSYDRLPEALAKEVRSHLGELQSSAFLFEAHGAIDRAEELRAVANNLGSMLHVTQQFCREKIPFPVSREKS